MKEFDCLNDQMLGTFVDGLLDPANCEIVLRAMEEDPDVRDRVYKMRRAKDLMKLAFGDATTPSSKQQQKPERRHLFSTRLAASVAALAVSFGAGIFGQQYYSDIQAGNTTQTIPAIAQHRSEKVILHVQESDPKQFSAALTYAEKFLAEHEAQGHEIEVVAHAGGVDMMRVDVSPLKAQIVELMEKYNNVHFIACANAIRMLRKKGIEPTIISGVGTDSTAFDHIVGRLQSGGWYYIKVESLDAI